MSNELHIAFSEMIKGAGLIACGPFESVEFVSGGNTKWDENWFYKQIRDVT